MATTATKRPPTLRTNRAQRKDATEELADRLATNLKISAPRSSRTARRPITDAKSKVPLKTLQLESPEKRLQDAMGVVNVALQHFTSAVGSKWTASAARRDADEETMAGSSTLAQSARVSLKTIRDIRGPDAGVDVERVALGVVGKLVSLELFGEALGITTDVREPLTRLYTDTALPGDSSTSTVDLLALLGLPLPTSSTPLGESLQSIVLTYLQHGLSIVVNLLAPDREKHSSFVEVLTNATDLPAWIPCLPSLPPKTHDSALKRRYVLLTTAFGSPTTAPIELLTIRFVALQSLLLTTDMDVDAFWQQALKFGHSFVKISDAAGVDENGTIRMLLERFSATVAVAEQACSEQKSYVKGKGWVAFCEYWVALAKRIGDLDLLDRIAGYIRIATGNSTAQSSWGIPSPNGKSPIIARAFPSSDDIDLQVSRICSSLSQTSAFLEKLGTQVVNEMEISERIEQGVRSHRECRDFLNPRSFSTTTARKRVMRAMEALRRRCMKGLDSSHSHKDILCSFIENIVDDLGQILQMNNARTADEAKLTISALDSMFNLATINLSPLNVACCERSFVYLSKATKIVDVYAESLRLEESSERGDEFMNVANYTRCTSGAFFNCAGSLYKAEKHGLAVRFLNEACALAEKALDRYNDATSTTIVSNSKRDKNSDIWETHRNQLFKRWELLGVCHCKMGNRKLGHVAFVRAVAKYPFDIAVAERLGADPTVDIFSDRQQLANLIDRLTYIGAAELFLKSATSLLPALQENDVPALCIGAVLERQIRSLDESKWKPAIQDVIWSLMHDLLLVYTSEGPLRRAKVLVWKLELAYFSKARSIFVDDLAEEIRSLLSVESIGKSKLASTLKMQLLASTSLWLALHANKSGVTGSAAAVLHHATEAHRTLLQLFPAQTDSTLKASTVRGSGIRAPRVKRAAVTKSRTKEPPQGLPMTPKNKHESTDARRDNSLQKVIQRQEHFEVLIPLLYSVSQLLGLLGYVLPKMRLLLIIRRICESKSDSAYADFVRASLELAHEFGRLGRTDRAILMYSSIIAKVKDNKLPSAASVILRLRYSESLAESGNVAKSVAVYEEAAQLFCDLTLDEEGLSTVSRIRKRALSLEIAAVAAQVFATIQLARDDCVECVSRFLQTLRLLNRAADTLSRLTSTSTKIESLSSIADSDPFTLTSLKNALPNENPRDHTPVAQVVHGKSSLDGLEWRVAEGLLHTMLTLSRVYFQRGFAREAEYFAQQAKDLASVLRAPAMISRALSSKGETQLHLGQLEEAQTTLSNASGLVEDIHGPDIANATRLRGDHYLLNSLKDDAECMYVEAAKILGETGNVMSSLDVVTRKSIAGPASPKSTQRDALVAPNILASVLKQHVWMLRDDSGEEYDRLLSRLLSLPQTADIQAECNSLLAKLAFHGIHERFKADMFLSSLAESTIAIPMALIFDGKAAQSPATGEILGALDHAEKLCLSGLETFGERATVPHLRSAAVSLALLRAYQTSLGKPGKNAASLAFQMLDFASSITLRRELLEAISNKLQDGTKPDDMDWPSFAQGQTKNARANGLIDFSSPRGSPQPEDIDLEDATVRRYWEHVRSRHQARIASHSNVIADIDSLPSNWVVVNISISEDKRTLLVARQRARHEPLVFFIPLRGRRESDDDEHFTYEDAIDEFREIIRCSDEGTRQAPHIRNDDKEGKSAWWAERKRLDTKLRELLENIEFCWLGAFKTILSPPMQIPPDVITSLRARLEKVFKNVLGPHEKKLKGKLKLDTCLLECLTTLPPTCRDEELEDIAYFILDLYHFHGVPVALAEVDTDVLAVDLRSALEEHAARTRGRVVPEPGAHTFLVLDRRLQALPWESLPALRGQSVSRVPGIDFLLDRLALARMQRGLPLDPPAPPADAAAGAGADARDGDADGDAVVDRVAVDAAKGFFVLNPGGDLKGTEGRFAQWAADMRRAGWDGLVGTPPSEQQLLNALERQDLVVYFGHGGAEQYMRSHRLRHLRRCAATMLWGCSSGALRDMGEFDRVGTPNNYMLAGCPTLVANLWDVTDRDIDKFALAVFAQLRLEPAHVARRAQHRRSEAPSGADADDAAHTPVSVVTAVAQSRDACKLPYLTGAAPVVYGIPFYL